MHGAAGNGWHVHAHGQGSFIDLSAQMVNGGGGCVLNMLAPEEAAKKPKVEPHAAAADEPAPPPGTATPVALTAPYLWPVAEKGLYCPAPHVAFPIRTYANCIDHSASTHAFTGAQEEGDDNVVQRIFSGLLQSDVICCACGHISTAPRPLRRHLPRHRRASPTAAPAAAPACAQLPAVRACVSFPQIPPQHSAYAAHMCRKIANSQGVMQTLSYGDMGARHSGQGARDVWLSQSAKEVWPKQHPLQCLAQAAAALAAVVRRGSDGGRSRAEARRGGRGA